jgi:hypothetical protein
MLRRPLDQEIAGRRRAASDLRPDAGIGRRQRRVRQARPVAANLGSEGVGARRVDAVVKCADRLPRVGRAATRRRARSVPARRGRGSDERPGRRFRQRIDQPRERRAAGEAYSSCLWRDGLPAAARREAGERAATSGAQRPAALITSGPASAGCRRRRFEDEARRLDRAAAQRAAQASTRRRARRRRAAPASGRGCR